MHRAAMNNSFRVYSLLTRYAYWLQRGMICLSLSMNSADLNPQTCGIGHGNSMSFAVHKGILSYQLVSGQFLNVSNRLFNAAFPDDPASENSGKIPLGRPELLRVYSFCNPFYFFTMHPFIESLNKPI